MSPQSTIACSLACLFLGGATMAAPPPQKLLREDVIEVPAIGEGLCVSYLFQSNMVIQRDKPVSVWSWAAPGEQVTVAFGGASATAAAGPDRSWKVTLPAMPANATPQRMTVKGAANTLVLEIDTEVGDPGDGAIEGFAIAGRDRRFQPATATYQVEGTDDRGRPRQNRRKLVLSSPLVPDPIHFRYAWGRNPLANLQATGNKDLPFATQRSDDWHRDEVPLGVLGDNTPDEQSRAQRNQILKVLRLEDTRRRLNEAERFIDENKERYEAEVKKLEPAPQ